MIIFDSYGITLLHYAAYNGDLEKVKTFLTASNINIRTKCEYDIQGMTPLHYAARKGNLGVCKHLLLNGADSSLKNHEGLTAKQLAVKFCHAEIVELFNMSYVIK